MWSNHRDYFTATRNCLRGCKASRGFCDQPVREGEFGDSDWDVCCSGCLTTPCSGGWGGGGSKQVLFWVCTCRKKDLKDPYQTFFPMVTLREREKRTMGQSREERGLVLFKLTLLKYNFYAIKFTNLKSTVQWVLTKVLSCVNSSKNFNFSYLNLLHEAYNFVHNLYFCF